MQKGTENHNLGVKPRVWRHWPNYFERTKKSTQFIEQVNAI